jgi:hypothetical protein
MKVRQRVTGIDMAGLKIKSLFWPPASALPAARFCIRVLPDFGKPPQKISRSSNSVIGSWPVSERISSASCAPGCPIVSDMREVGIFHRQQRRVEPRYPTGAHHFS